MTQELETAKEDLKRRIIEENSEEYYYKLIGKRVEYLKNIK